MMQQLQIIQDKARAYAKARGLLSERLGSLQNLQQRIFQRRLPGIRTALAETKDTQSALRASIDANRDQFNKPRTQTFSGIKVGLQAKAGKIVVENEAKTIQLIRAKLPKEKAELLINTTEKVSKSGLQSLSAAELKAIGCSLEPGHDTVVIKAQDGELEKLMKAILKEEKEELES